MKTGCKKKDLILIGAVLGIALLCSLLYGRSGSGSGYVTIKVDGEQTGSYSLFEDQEILINQGTNVLQIRDGEAYMLEADCPDQICVHQKAVSANGESIICLPNRVVVEVHSDQEREMDAVTD